MRVMLRQHYQDAHIHYAPDQIVDVDAKMAAYLIGNKMAVAVDVPEVKRLEVEPQFEQAEEPPQPVELPEFEKPHKRSRRNHEA